MTINLNLHTITNFSDTLRHKRMAENMIRFAASANFSSQNLPFTRNLNGENSKAEYLRWVDSWKYQYANLSNMIRFLKAGRKKEIYSHILNDIAVVGSGIPHYSGYQTGNGSSYLDRIETSLGYLQDAAQVMLAARLNAKMLSNINRNR